MPTRRRVLIVLDEGGVGAALVKKLEKRGVTLLAAEAATPTDDLLAQVADFTTEAPLTGVYWLASLDDEGPLEALDAAGANRVRELNADNVRAFFKALS